jgi:hypothetical protein
VGPQHQEHSHRCRYAHEQKPERVVVLHDVKPFRCEGKTDYKQRRAASLSPAGRVQRARKISAIANQWRRTMMTLRDDDRHDINTRRVGARSSGSRANNAIAIICRRWGDSGSSPRLVAACACTRIA